MTLFGSVQPGHAPVNNYELRITGFIDIFFAEVSGIEVEVQEVDLPDRTKASGGQTVPQEFTAMTMIHHTLERAALESWFTEGQEPVQATYKKTATLYHKSISGANVAVYSLEGLWIKKRKLPDLSKENEGEAGMIEWTFSVDKTELLT